MAVGIYTTSMLCWKRIGLRVQALDQFIKYGKLLTAEVRTLYTWGHGRDAECKGWTQPKTSRVGYRTI